jgi:thiol-disulfide isomerase/thioredoxin
MKAAFLLPVALLVGWLLGRSPQPIEPRAAALPAVPTAAPPAVPAAAPLRVEPTSPPVGEARGVLSRWTTIVNADHESRRTGKPILLDFNAAWSPPCGRLKREVFGDPRLDEVVRRTVVPVSLADRSRESGGNSPEVETLMESYSIEDFPTLVVYMPGTDRIMRRRGYDDAEATARWIQDAAAAVR